ncbi:MAG: dihydroorotate dehydrogenase electron transfer subunit [Spirochaetaceae bacterium]|jgi:NAD(P)H-flavin reductase|nr:dihydroorotate dehydrogenase electron transfer subunit [Spirochaetaceae bacterium]
MAEEKMTLTKNTEESVIISNKNLGGLCVLCVRTSSFPKPGQFFMLKPKYSSVFLPRPISYASYKNETLTFLIEIKGRGTEEIAALQKGDSIEITGPLGNSWLDFIPSREAKEKDTYKFALVAGGLGLAPLCGFAALRESSFFCGFSHAIPAEITSFLPQNTVFVTEDGSIGKKGFVTDYINPADYDAVFSCGPKPMLKKITEMCSKTNTPCFISMENRMACGVGACLGCTIKTLSGNKHCCKDGPVFNAKDIIFDE